ncbi:MAG: metalloregulator ArsR/SmtB family transcription factor [Chloroflexota bacterium]|nr:metalloregulator ArsR/SmtB family transcription factor [Chloroflexota bacterium]
MNEYQLRAKIFQVLAHPVRLRILDLLSQEEACVCHLTTALGKRQPYVSQQLAALRRAGLVTDHKDGLMVYYRLSDQRVMELLALGRTLLQEQGADVTFTPLPDGPLPGCPCPHCREK